MHMHMHMQSARAAQKELSPHTCCLVSNSVRPPARFWVTAPSSCRLRVRRGFLGFTAQHLSTCVMWTLINEWFWEFLHFTPKQKWSVYTVYQIYPPFNISKIVHFIWCLMDLTRILHDTYVWLICWNRYYHSKTVRCTSVLVHHRAISSNMCINVLTRRHGFGTPPL